MKSDISPRLVIFIRCESHSFVNIWALFFCLDILERMILYFFYDRINFQATIPILHFRIETLLRHLVIRNCNLIGTHYTQCALT